MAFPPLGLLALDENLDYGLKSLAAVLRADGADMVGWTAKFGWTFGVT